MSIVWPELKGVDGQSLTSLSKRLVRGGPRFGWMDGVKVTVKAARQ